MFTKEQCLKDFRTFAVSESILLPMAVDLLAKMDETQFGALKLNSLGLDILDIVEFTCNLDDAYNCVTPDNCCIVHPMVSPDNALTDSSLTVTAWLDLLHQCSVEA